MLTLRHYALITLALVPLARCGGDSSSNDGGTDGSVDSSVADAKKEAAVDSGSDVVADVASDVTGDVASDVVVDSPNDSPSEAGDGGWTVASISGLVLWLDANKGVVVSGGSISTWADQSGQSNNASAGTAAPTLASSSINSLPAAHFVGTSAQSVSIADATSLQFGTGDYTIAVVAKFDNAADAGVNGFGALYTKLGTSSGLLFFANDLDLGASADAGMPVIYPGLSNLEDPTTGVSYQSAYNDGTARLYAVQRASGTETLRVNGTQVASASSAIDVTESGMSVNIGSMASGGALDGDIAEIVAVKGTLSSSDLTSLEAYLKSKYAL